MGLDVLEALSANAPAFENIKTFVVMTFDDFLLRNEWSKGLQAISDRNLRAVHDTRVLDLCEKHDVLATLFVPSYAATLFRNEFLEIVQRKFDIAGHGFNHEDFRKVSPSVQIQLINKAITTLENVCRVKVSGWRSPGLFLNRDIKSAISKSRIHWCSNIRFPSFLRHLPFKYYHDQKVEIPITSLFNDHDLYEKLGLSSVKVLRKWLRDFSRMRCRKSPEVFVLLMHPWVEVKSSDRMRALETFLETMKATEGVDFKTCTEVYHYSQIQPTAHFRNCFSKVEASFIESLISYSVKSGVWRRTR